MRGVFSFGLQHQHSLFTYGLYALMRHQIDVAMVFFKFISPDLTGFSSLFLHLIIFCEFQEIYDK